MPDEVQVTRYVPHRPVGERCGHAQIHHDGRPDNEWDTRAVPDFFAEMKRLHSNDLDPRLTYAQHLDYQAQLGGLMQKAKYGTVSFRNGEEGKPLRDLIVELKPKLESDRPAFGKEPPQLRLYLGEPQVEPRKLLGLCLQAKAAGLSGLPEQDEHIDIAIERAEVWARG